MPALNSNFKIIAFNTPVTVNQWKTASLLREQKDYKIADNKTPRNVTFSRTCHTPRVNISRYFINFTLSTNLRSTVDENI